MYKLRLINVCLAIGGRPLQDRHPSAEVAAFRGMQRTRAQNPNAVIVAEYWGHGLKAAGFTLCDWLTAFGPPTFSRISSAGEEQVPEQWFRQQTDDHCERIVIRFS